MNQFPISATQAESFLEALEQLPDFRDNRGKIHSYSFTITAVIFAILSGKSTTSSIHRFIKNKISWLIEMTKMKEAKVISRAHLPRLLSGIDWESLDAITLNYFNLHLSPGNAKEEWVAIDGKVLRGTLKLGSKQAVIHAVGHESRGDLAQARQSGDKSSEIPVVRELLKKSGLEKKNVTLDAHHCNPETLSQIALGGGVYLTQVKDNQPVLLKVCQDLAAQEKNPLFSNEEHEKEHGRQTSRYAKIHSLNKASLDSRWKEASIQTLVVIKRNTRVISADTESSDTSYYISNSTMKNNELEKPSGLVKAIRKHWGVESNNWILDVTFNEDKVKIKEPNQAQIMSKLRSLIIQMLRKSGIKNFQAAIDTFADLPDSMESMLRQVRFL